MYMFQFINSYISNYIIAYWVRDFGQLATNLITIMVGKQVAMNVIEMLMDKILIGRKIKAVKTRYVKELQSADQNDTIALEEIKMH